MAVPKGHPLSAQKQLRYLDTLAYEHVVMPINSAVELMLQREASRVGKRLMHRVIVTNFEAALRVVRAGLAIAVVPREVTSLYADAFELDVLPLDEPWALRRFILCHRGEDVLTPAALLLLEFLSGTDQDEGSAR